MQVPYFRRLCGVVTLRCSLKEPGSFLESLKFAGIETRNLSFDSNGMLILSMNARDFLRIRGIVRQHSCAVKIISRSGWPVYRRRIRGRAMFVCGLVALFIALYFLTSLIWKIEVTGNQRLASDDILAVAKKQGIAPLRRKSVLAEPTEIAKRLQQELKETSWIGVDIHGTTVRIRVIEEKPVDYEKPTGGHHFIANKTATITQVLAERGKPVVQVDQKVNRGDVLISGWIGSEEHSKLVQAKGMVKGMVWYDIHITVPLQQRLKRYTGNTYLRRYVMIGRRAIQFNGYAPPPFRKYTVDTRLNPFLIAGYRLPIGEMYETLREVHYEVRTLTVAEAEKLGLTQARLHFLKNMSNQRMREVEIRKQHAMMMKRSKSSIQLRVFFEVEEDIGQYAEIEMPAPSKNKIGCENCIE